MKTRTYHFGCLIERTSSASRDGKEAGKTGTRTRPRMTKISFLNLLFDVIFVFVSGKFIK